MAAAFLLYCALAFAADGPAPSISKEPCKLAGIEMMFQCVRLDVPENWDKPDGRTISLRAVIFPASEPNPEKHALFHMEGGPGISAVAAAAKFYATDGIGYWKNRDVVLLEQRGTGDSHPLACPGIEKRTPFEEMYPVALVAECRKELETKTDLSQYNSLSAIKDVETLRSTLGYGKIDLWGQSYGTRMELLYLSRYSENVRSIVLQGTVKQNTKMPLYHAANAESVLRRVFEECRSDARCNKAYPKLSMEWESFLKKQPEQKRGILAEAFRKTMNTTDGLRRLPYLIHQAFGGSLKPLVETFSGPGPQLAEGAYLSITCAEDVPWITADEEKSMTSGTSFGNYRIVQQKNACAQWPKGLLSADFFEPVTSDVPVLFLVGSMDMTTPVAWSLERSRSLPNSRVVTIPEMGHIIAGLTHLECYDQIVLEFYDMLSPNDLDVSCLASMKPPEFLIK